MSSKIVGLDLGTNSLGLGLRNPDNGKNILDQIEFFTVNTFKAGVGRNDKGAEVSYAAQRTEKRSARRLYQSRKYRKWATLRLLIKHGFCPLNEEELNKWRLYDSEKGYTRKYPVEALEFESWIRLDFNSDGKPDYSSPYQLRDELLHVVLDFNSETYRFKFGRAVYHIAQRRGFKSSKGETIKDAGEETDISDIDVSSELKKSEEKKSKGLREYMAEHNCETVGSAFAKMERDGLRVRNSPNQAVRSQYQDEVKLLCERQGIDKSFNELYIGLTSTKKGEGTIFYRRPLRSQKGNVGECTLEPNHKRCPISHPDYELFRAYSFINNIKFRISLDNQWQPLDDIQRDKLFDEKFTGAKGTFKFADIRAWIEKNITNCPLSYDNRTVNYKDNATVAGCPIINRLKKILGPDWQTNTLETSVKRITTNKETGEIRTHPVSYNYEDIWHLCYNSDDVEEITEMLKSKTSLNDKVYVEIGRMWGAMQEGYAPLSLKAIRNILPFLREGLIYSEAVGYAKLPEIIGKDVWNNHKEELTLKFRELASDINKKRKTYNIANTVISHYKMRDLEEQQAYKNTEYTLSETDKQDVLNCIIDIYSEKRWNALNEAEQNEIQKEVEDLYQKFLYSPKRSYYNLPKQSEAIKEYLYTRFPAIDKSRFDQLYHHSQIDLFPQAERVTIENGDKVMSVPQLGKPDIGSIKNPAVMRALYVLRNTLNHLLREGRIDETTRMVVETAREMNDANHRKAIEAYQKKREDENKIIADIIKEFRPNYSDEDIEKGRLLFEQNLKQTLTKKELVKAQRFAVDMEKYKLWKEQDFRCIYTNKPIGLADLFDDSKVDIEHTVPRSVSFDNSLSNRTVCESHFNRHVKKNMIPSELTNYDEILERIKPWQKHVEHIKEQIQLWIGKSKTASTVDYKNTCIQQRIMWQLELDYWQKKVNTFLLKKDELDFDFRNSQLVDTRIITKYAYHYLKSVFDHVEVQRGETTALFRKILGVQSLDEKKDRSKHSHHAVDATVLTLVPSAAKRDKMIESFYKWEEAKALGLVDKDAPNTELEKEKSQMFNGSVSELLATIENNILINQISKDQCLTPSRKRRRNAGKLVRGNDGKVQWVQGDCIRGSLHKDSFYGVIQNNKEKRVVIRKELNGPNGLIKGLLDAAKDAKKYESALEVIVDEGLRKMLKTQIDNYLADENISKTDILNKPFYTLDKNGNAMLHDKNGKPLSPIRHVRCYAKAGVGFLQSDTLLKIKDQTYISKHDYKRTYYVQTDDNYLCLLYEGVYKGKIEKELRIVSLFETSCLKNTGKKILNINELKEESDYKQSPKKRLPLKAILKRGTRIIFYDSFPEEIPEYNQTELSKRLYAVYKFNNIGVTSYLYLRHHLESRVENMCEKKEIGTAFDKSETKSYLRLNSSTLNALIEHIDFEVNPVGEIIFIKKH